MSATQTTERIAEEKDTHIHVRWLVRRDMGEVMAIERRSFKLSWSEDKFLRTIRQRNCIGMVAEYENQVVGFMVYELQKTRIHVLNFAVHPDYRRRGMGTQMLATLTAKLSIGRREKIRVRIHPANNIAQIFFCNNKFVPPSLENTSADTCGNILSEPVEYTYYLTGKPIEGGESMH